MSIQTRSYRRELTSHGILSFNQKKLSVTVKNLSMTGMLAELSDEEDGQNLKNISDKAENSNIIDIQLPEMNLSGTAEIIRFDEGERTCVALEFKQLTYKRKTTRKRSKLATPLFNDSTMPSIPEENEAHVA